jgi:general secretion pathway protein H
MSSRLELTAKQVATVPVPTSATGSDPARLRALTRAGFTLLELMGVLLVMGLVTALVVVRLEQQPERDLNLDAQRLAAQLDILRQQAWSQGQALVWVANDQGYGWSSGDALLARLDTSPPQVSWLSSQTRSATPSLLLPAEPVSGPLKVVLTSSANPQWRATLQAQGLSPFTVVLHTPAAP